VIAPLGWVIAAEDGWTLSTDATCWPGTWAMFTFRNPRKNAALIVWNHELPPDMEKDALPNGHERPNTTI
jgi:hypothetical protein